MISFGIVAEGATDQIVIENILIGYFDDLPGEKIEVNFLQPSVDETDNFGGWYNALEYCKSDDFTSAFDFLDYVVIHIDTDICDNLGINLIGQDDNSEVFLGEIREKIINDYISKETYERLEDNIIFALSVHSIECWLLPIFFKNEKREKILNCLDVLNRELSKKNKKLIINPRQKDPRKYNELSKPYLKRKNLLKHYKHNPSLKMFIDALENHFGLLDYKR